MRRDTPHVIQLHRMYETPDGRLQADDRWKKLPLFWFLLFLSYRCTRRCSYCYSFNQVGDDNTSEMNDRTFARLLEWIPEVWKVNNVKVNSIGFLGGEPLLRTDRIKAVMDSVYRHTDGMQGYVYTNGDVIDDVHWDDLEDIQWITTNICDVSLEELGRRMGIVKARSNVVNQTVIATLDDFNLERVLDITRFGVEHGYRLRFHRNLYRGLDAGYKARLLAKYHEVIDLLERYLVKGYDVHTTFLFDTLIPMWEHETAPYPCGKRIAAVFPDGRVGPCIRDHECSGGTIFDPDPMRRIDCETFHYGEHFGDECGTCDSRTACQGGCPHDKLLLTGTASGPSVMCDIHREIIPRLKHLDRLKQDATLSSRSQQ